MSDQLVTLEFMARQQARLLEEMAAFREDVAVLTAISASVEASVSALITEMRVAAKVGAIS